MTPSGSLTRKPHPPYYSPRYKTVAEEVEKFDQNLAKSQRDLHETILQRIARKAAEAQQKEQEQK